MSTSETPSNSAKLTSVELAELIIDALLRADLLKKGQTTRAVEIATEEIEVRKALGDY